MATENKFPFAGALQMDGTTLLLLLLLEFVLSFGERTGETINIRRTTILYDTISSLQNGNNLAMHLEMRNRIIKGSPYRSWSGIPWHSGTKSSSSSFPVMSFVLDMHKR